MSINFKCGCVVRESEVLEACSSDCEIQGLSVMALRAENERLKSTVDEQAALISVSIPPDDMEEVRRQLSEAQDVIASLRGAEWDSYSQDQDKAFCSVCEVFEGDQHEDWCHFAVFNDVPASPVDPSPLQIIVAERRRQVTSEGWTSEHDDEHTDGSLAQAAACYAMHPGEPDSFAAMDPPELWPWDPSWWKPSPDDRMRELAKAGALILAEMERLHRAAPQDEPDAESERDEE